MDTVNIWALDADGSKAIRVLAQLNIFLYWTPCIVDAIGNYAYITVWFLIFCVFSQLCFKKVTVGNKTTSVYLLKDIMKVVLIYMKIRKLPVHTICRKKTDMAGPTKKWSTKASPQIVVSIKRGFFVSMPCMLYLSLDFFLHQINYHTIN